MKFLAVLASLALAAPLAAASAILERGPGFGGSHRCVSQRQANDIVEKFKIILNHEDVPFANATAQKLLAEGYIQVSDSILSLQGRPLGGITFDGKQLYIEGVLAAPNLINMDDIEILVAGCDKVLWYWNFRSVGSAQFPVKGFNLFQITPAGQISEVYIEFNSVAWGLDTGFQVIPPAAPAPA